MEEKKLTEKESLELIAQMIEETKSNIEKGDGNYFLLWGYLSTAIALIIYFVWTYTGNHWIFCAWWIIPIFGYLYKIIRERNSPKRVMTYIDRIVSQVWIVCGVCVVTAPIASLFVEMPILFIESLLLTMCVAITGLIIKYKTISLSGFAGIALSFGLLFVPSDIQILFFAAMFIVTMIIPGHLLNAASTRDKKSDPSVCLKN